MEKKYVTPEVKVVEMETTPLMATSGEQPKATAEGAEWSGLEDE